MDVIHQMALFFLVLVVVPFCEKVLSEEDEIVGTTHFIDDDEHPLFQYSDAVMHRVCFQKWDQRAAFVAAYNNSIMGYVHRMRPDGVIRKRFLFWFPCAVIDLIAKAESWLKWRSD